MFSLIFRLLFKKNVQSSIVWNVASLKICQIGKLSEAQKLELKNSRPTPDIAITQDCSSSGMKF